jgi:biopolymer transport protein ExbD
MAELQTAGETSRRHKPGTRRSKKLSTRVDLTPMVDLGFLLITFFFVSSTWSKPHGASIILPANGDSMTLGKTPALTVVALDAKRLFYYNGDFASSLKEGSYGIPARSATLPAR